MEIIAEKITLQVDGMTCNNCALGIGRFLEKQGASDVNVSFPNAEASFQIADKEQIPQLINGINKLGFQASDANQPKIEQSKNRFQFGLRSKLIFCAIFTLPLLLAMIPTLEALHRPLVQLLLCLPVMLVGWWHFGRSAWQSLKTGVPNMDVLIVIGSTAAFIYSVSGYLMHLGNDFLFFETAATIVTLVLLGNYIEHRSVQQTTTAIKELTQLQPETAQLVMTDTNSDRKNIVHIPVKNIKSGQSFLVNEGDKIPTDGEIIWGSAMIDESLMTGESEKVNKKIGDDVIGGTILSSGSIQITATKVGKDTALSQIIELVKQAQQHKPKIQRLADQVSAVFVPTVLGIALLTFLLEYYQFGYSFQNALLNSIAVLVVACPCAMGLATPTAVMVGVGRAAQNGILFKGTNAMSILKKIEQVVFDKTGTLTSGRFDFNNVHSEIDEELFRSILFNLEQHSSHPIARSIVAQLKNRKLKPFHFEEVKEIKGIGIIGKDGQGNTYSVGSHKLVSSLTKDLSHDIYMLKNGKLIGWLDLNDTLKENAPMTIRELEEMGIESHLLSGDIHKKTKAIAQEVGIQNYHAGKVPEEKLKIISEISQQGTTAMVGDGINDAPALAKADIGISLSNATQVAIQSAQVILLNGDISKLPLAVNLSKATVKTIRQNLFWAFFYNILMIPIAALGFLNPMIAAFAMAFSDIIVIGNSIRLKYKKV